MSMYKFKSKNGFFSYYESAVSTSVASSASIEEDEKKKEDFHHLRSMSMFSGTDTLASKVFVVDYSRTDLFRDTKVDKNQFCELRFIRKGNEEVSELKGMRDKSNPFRIGLTQLSTASTCMLYCKEITKIDFFDSERKMDITLQEKIPKKFIIIRFHHFHDYEVLKKKLQSILLLENKQTYKKIVRLKGEGTNKAIQKTYSLKNRLTSSGIYSIKFPNWKKKQFKRWFSKIYIFDPNEKSGKNLVKTVNQYLNLYFPRIYRELLSFLEKEDNDLSSLANALTTGSPSPPNLYSVLSLSSEEEKKENLDDNLKYFTKVFIQHIRTLGHLDVCKTQVFSKPYYKVFEKMLRHSTVESLDNFQRLFRRVRFDEIKLWDYEELRDWILVLILFNTPLQIRKRVDSQSTSYESKKDLITHFEEFFEKFCLDQLDLFGPGTNEDDDDDENEGEDSDDDDEDTLDSPDFEKIMETPNDLKSPVWQDDSRESKIPPDRFDEFLLEFNRINGFEIQKLSFPFQYKMRRNEKRKEIQKHMNEASEIKKKNRKLWVEKSELEKKMSSVQEDYNQVMEDMMTRIEDEDFLMEAPIKMEELEVQTNDLEKEIEQKKSEMEVNSKKIKKIEEKKLDQCHFDLQLLQCPQYSENEWIFLRSQERRDEIKKLLTRRLEFLKKEYGVLELIVKLVLSRFKEARAKGYQRSIMKLINPLKPKFFTFGFIHSSVLIKNIGFHWLSNELVFIKDLDLSDGYEDIFCVDAHCPILFNNMDQLIDVVESLSLQIVDWNARTKYSSWGGPASLISKGSSSSAMNCQEATLKLVEKLDFTKFYREVWCYVDGMKARVDAGKDKVLRFFETKWIQYDDQANGEEAFIKKFDAKVLKGRRVLEFERHRDLDEFVLELLGVDPNLRLNFPGIWQLLKAFDRSFWLIQLKTKENEMTKESRLRCPFKAKEREKHDPDDDYSL